MGLDLTKSTIEANDILFRAHSIGDLCGAKGLGKTGEKLARYTYLEHTTGRRKEFTSKQTKKGTLTEDLSIQFLSERLGRQLSKNNTRLHDEYFTGECDVDDVEDDCVIDVKGSWDVFTHDDNITSYNSDHEHQLRVYMRLYKRNKAKLVYILNDAPDDMVLKALEIESYNHPERETPEWKEVEIIKNMIFTRDNFDRFIQIRGLGGDELTDKLIDYFVEIPLESRIKEFNFSKSEDQEYFLVDRVKMARDYLRRTYKIK